MKILFLLPIFLCSCSTAPIPPDQALTRNFVTECECCQAKNTLRPISSRNTSAMTLPDQNLAVTKVLTFRCVSCKKKFTQESEPIIEPIRPKALLAK